MICYFKLYQPMPGVFRPLKQNPADLQTLLADATMFSGPTPKSHAALAPWPRAIYSHFMRTLLAILPYAIAVSLAATILVLLGGLFAMTRSQQSPRGSNRMMRARIAAQGLTVALIVLYLVLRALA